MHVRFLECLVVLVNNNEFLSAIELLILALRVRYPKYLLKYDNSSAGTCTRKIVTSYVIGKELRNLLLPAASEFTQTNLDSAKDCFDALLLKTPKARSLKGTQ